MTNLGINERFEAIEKRIQALEQVNQEKPQLRDDPQEFAFSDKRKEHTELLRELLKSDYCHEKNGLTTDHILGIFKKAGRPVVPKKINDLLHVWKMRKKIEAIKIKGTKQHRYFWIENESEKSNN